MAWLPSDGKPHRSAPTAPMPRRPFGPLQQHDCNQARARIEMDNQDYNFPLVLRLCGFDWAGRRQVCPMGARRNWPALPAGAGKPGQVSTSSTSACPDTARAKDAPAGPIAQYQTQRDKASHRLKLRYPAAGTPKIIEHPEAGPTSPSTSKLPKPPIERKRRTQIDNCSDGSSSAQPDGDDRFICRSRMTHCNIVI